jgi:hypothetical protein
VKRSHTLWRMPPVVHRGDEKAAPGAGRDPVGNALQVRHARTVKVSIVRPTPTPE